VPDVIQDAIVLERPSIASIIAKMVRRKRLHSQISLPIEVVKSVGESYAPMSFHNIPELIFSSRELEYMNDNGYTMEDANLWASILLERDSDVAASRLDSYMFPTSPRECTSGPRLVPVTILQMLAKRMHLSSRALQILLTCTWHVLRFRPFHTSREEQCIQLFKRLVRAALKVWPESIPNIASLLIIFLPGNSPGFQPTFNPSSERRLVLTEAFNNAIDWLSLPMGPKPYISCVYQEKAQFMILSHMVLYNPPLQVNGAGFAALAKVQLKRSKTTQEEEWAALQSRAWPPYPKPKTAMDEDKGFEFGASRAIRTLQHMRQAGYAYPEWERVARIYAGWDVDNTPTIQTRVAYLSNHTAVHEMNAEYHAWAARIATTRDIRESWALFLQYQSAQLSASPMVYHQMFQKIVQESRRASQEVTRPDDGDISPGDYKEVIPPATSPMQRVFLSSEPPTFMQLFNHMMDEGVRVRPWFLGYLLSASPSISDGLSIWERVKEDPGASLLVAAACGELDEQRNMRLVELRGLIELLCRFAWNKNNLTHLFTDQQLRDIRKGMHLQQGIWDHYDSGSRAIGQAMYLARRARVFQPYVWLSLMRGILVTLHDCGVPERPPAFLFFGPVMGMLSTMKTLNIIAEESFFDKLCHYLELAGRSARKAMPMAKSDKSVGAAAEFVMENGSNVLRRAFANLVTATVNKAALEASTAGTPAENWVPRTIKTINPVLCQHYIRALATFSDFEGIYSFARWLVANEADVVASLEQVNRASSMWTVVIVAFRVALEFPEHMFREGLIDVSMRKRAPPELVQLVRETLESMTELGGWATDSQVEDYASHIEMHNAMRQHRWAITRSP
jgi:hypothetical protein